jgi:hypothetical protein
MMRVLCVSVACWLAATPAAAVSPAGTTAIPAQFRGEWNSRLVACGTDEWDPVVIEATSLDFSDYVGRVQRVIRHSNRSITVFANYSAEGHGWDRVNRFVLSRSGNELAIHTPKSILGRYHRCPTTRLQHRA